MTEKSSQLLQICQELWETHLQKHP